MRILVTGATGFIGSHFVNTACAAGHDVLGLRRPGSTPRVPVSAAVRWLDKPLAAVEPADCAGVDALVHFAAAGVSPTSATWDGCFRANVTDSLALWIAAVRDGVKRFVICGTCFEYGASGPRYERIPPTAPLEPTGPYHASKAAATMAALALAYQERVAVAVLRPFHVFGEGEESGRLWPSLKAAARSGADYPMTLGEQIRDFVPVEDVAATFLDVCVNRPLEPGRPEVHNVGTGRSVTILAFAEHWWREWGAKGRLLPGAIPYRAGEVMRYVPELSL
jgi:nucleoside-diphosphate-sugar epimerase